MAYVIIFFGVSITSIGQNHARIQNCIAVHELIDNRIHFEREQALFSVYQNASFSVISSWLDIGSSVFKTWGGILEFTYNAFSLNDHMVSIDLIERLYWERIYQASQDLNNCINFS
jgi:hypothetical protein